MRFSPAPLNADNRDVHRGSGLANPGHHGVERPIAVTSKRSPTKVASIDNLSPYRPTDGTVVPSQDQRAYGAPLLAIAWLGRRLDAKRIRAAANWPRIRLFAAFTMCIAGFALTFTNFP